MGAEGEKGLYAACLLHASVLPVLLQSLHQAALEWLTGCCLLKPPAPVQQGVGAGFDRAFGDLGEANLSGSCR